MPKTKKPRHKATDEAFVQAWETYVTVQEVADRFRISRRAAISRAFRMRQAGVHLTRKPRSAGRTRAQVTKLNRLIERAP